MANSSNNTLHRVTKSDFIYLLLIMSIFVSAVIETDMYLPSFTDMMAYFGQNEESIQKILTWNFIGLCISGPFYGPISDAYGRRVPLLSALLLFFIGSFLTCMAENYDVLLIGRILQGLGSGGCFTIGTALIFDLYKQKQAMDVFNKMNTMVPFLMALAPLLGGYLNIHYGFRAIFYAIAFSVSLCLMNIFFFLEETLPLKKRIPLNISVITTNFVRVLKSSEFIQKVAIIGLLFGGFITFLSSISVLYIIDLKVDKITFPYYQCALLLSYLAASLSGTPLLNKYGVQFMKKIGLMCIVLSCICLIVMGIIYPKNAFFLTAAMIPFAGGCVWATTPYVIEVMEIMPDIKGITACVLTSLRLLIIVSIVGGTAYFYNGTIAPLVIMTLAITVVSVSLAYRVRER